MRREGMTVREAAEEWVREMNAIQQGMIDKLMTSNPDDWSELTVPAPGDTVYVFDLPEVSKNHYGEISSYDEESDLYSVNLSDGKLVSVEKDDFEVKRDGHLPMWGTMWSFGDSCDDWWLEKCNGIRLMSECGFRVYESEEFGYFFGIDGAGYSFYETHWVPLYRARGLQWHDQDTEKEAGRMKVYVVCGGCTGDEHIIAICKTPELANDRATSENRKCRDLNATVEEWTVEER